MRIRQTPTQLLKMSRNLFHSKMYLYITSSMKQYEHLVNQWLKHQVIRNANYDHCLINISLYYMICKTNSSLISSLDSHYVVHFSISEIKLSFTYNCLLQLYHSSATHIGLNRAMSRTLPFQITIIIQVQTLQAERTHVVIFISRYDIVYG